MSTSFFEVDDFSNRHNGLSTQEVAEMLSVLGVSSLDALIEETIPASIRMKAPLELPNPLSERQFLTHFRSLASKNDVFTSFIGMGYYDTFTPPVILRNILENPGWYTAYTPYQAEIAQGRLEMLLNFQTMVSDLTGMELANASLLDEGTAAAEAMGMLFSVRKKTKKKAPVFFASHTCHPQTLEVLKTRALPMGIKLEIGDVSTLDVTRSDLYGLLVQYPDTNGSINNFKPLFEAAKEHQVAIAVASDLLALTLLIPPGEIGADVVVGSSQRFGVPMGYGGPHAAFFATKEEYKRQIPGRIIGVTKDKDGNDALRMALQTREQHIRREKATSNICTAQVLLAVMAAAYGIYHGPDGLRRIARRVHGLTSLFVSGLRILGFEVEQTHWFDTVTVSSGKDTAHLIEFFEAQQINVRVFEDHLRLGFSFDEPKTIEDVAALLSGFAKVKNLELPNLTALKDEVKLMIPQELHRTSDILKFPVFEQYRTEHEMLRYLKRLENKDISLAHSMISLGSCTMKLNATTEMLPVTWREWSAIHPFAPKNQTLGYQQLFSDLEAWLCSITGFDAVSLQPNSGAQGEYTGLMTIRAYHEHRNESYRTVAIIPSSAHGTNPASAVMAGMEVVVVGCDDRGNINVEELKVKAEKYSDRLAALMVTYPSTHGVFEEDIREICEIIHHHGGLVYMDGANMNAQVGLTSPALIGADVCHLNLHKTFCIPHGGGGPGVGPIGVNSKLAPYLPGHIFASTGGNDGITAVSSAPWGSADILSISYAYIAMMGAEGLKKATQISILNANYIKYRLEGAYSILYTGKNGRAAHEMIVDLRPFKQSAGIEVVDIAKRLMDYGFHAPTVSFPVAGTVMIEPTESESKSELDRFCDAMLAIREEIREIELGLANKENNPLKNAPHTQGLVISDRWDFPYSREKASFPLPWVQERKVWPTVRRVDDAYGDRNLMCSCAPMEMYVETGE